MTTRRHFNASLIAAGAALASPLVRANDDAAIHVLVGFPAGGGSDVIARLLAEKLQAELGRTLDLAEVQSVLAREFNALWAQFLRGRPV